MLGDWLALAFVTGIVYLLLRPASPAAQFVESIGEMTVALVRSAADLVDS